MNCIVLSGIIVDTKAPLRRSGGVSAVTAARRGISVCPVEPILASKAVVTPFPAHSSRVEWVALTISEGDGGGAFPAIAKTPVSKISPVSSPVTGSRTKSGLAFSDVILASLNACSFA